MLIPVQRIDWCGEDERYEESKEDKEQQERIIMI
jgi:hypothetical protein